MPCVLTINGGSSSIRFAIYSVPEKLSLQLDGKIDRIGLPGATFTANGARTSQPLKIADHGEAVAYLVDWLREQPWIPSVKALGHRVVHGMKRHDPERVTPELLKDLRLITPYDPDHMPRELDLIEAFTKQWPDLPQVACFDTAFHRTMPDVAKRLPIPRRYGEMGIERYGFHGLSYSYLIEELGRIDPIAAKGRVILAHLGNGASLAAVLEGKSIDTSMGFTPTGGLVMSTRTGDLDPGLFYYLTKAESMTAPQFQKMVNHESGLLGISGTSSDMQDLLSKEKEDVRAAEAVNLFCFQAKKWIGSFAAALGGLDTLVFAGGIGENSPAVRARICAGLGFLGIEIRDSGNEANEAVISKGSGRVTVRVIRTDEEMMIARSVCRVLGLR